MTHFRRSPRPLVPAVLALLTIVATATADQPKRAADAALQAANALYDGITTTTLPNGLRVYLKPVPGAATVTTMVAYKVGSADEDLDNTGLSHYLEHLMFKGTELIKPGDIDRLTQRNGGGNNASTSEDMTLYHFDFAADRWTVGLKIEADRMRNIRIDAAHEFEQEKGAVINELQRNEDGPWDLEQKAILPKLFGPKSPYGHPVIGEKAHVRRATAAIIKAHYDKWYYPNNAALVVVGGFEPDAALATIKDLFGPIPKGVLPERKPEVPEPRKGPLEIAFPSKFPTPRLLFGWNTVRAVDADTPALDVVQALLTNGKTSRLYGKLVEGDEVAASVNANSQTGRYPGWFSIQVDLLPGKDPKQVEKLVLSELLRLGADGPTPAELKRAQQGLLAGAVFAQESVHSLAETIAQGVTLADLDYLKAYLPHVLAVTPADIKRVIKKYLDPETRVVVSSTPAGRPAGAGGKEPAPRERKLRRRVEDAAAPAAFSLKKAQRVELPNGMVLLLFENRRLPLVVADALVRHGELLQSDEQLGVASLTGALLDEGTADHTGNEIATLIDDVGGSLSMSSGGGVVRVLAPDRKLGLGLLFECLSRPKFAKEAFERDRARQLSEIAEMEAQPLGRAERVFRAAVYGANPLGRPLQGTTATVSKLTLEDCAAFHQKVFVPNNTIVSIVGDFDAAAVIEEVKALTAGWKKGDVKMPALPEMKLPAKFTQEIISMPQAEQLQFFMGHVGIRRDNPDYYKLLVLDNVLGTGPGFTDRLSMRLRDREGLAYTVRATIAASAGEQPGMFTCYIGTDNPNFARVKAEFLEELNRIRDEAPTKQEVDDAKQYLLGSLPFRTTTSPAIAALLLSVERYGLGLDYLADYRKGVEAVTAADIQASAKKYIHPERMVLVAAGAVDKEGKPLKMPIPAPRR